MEQMNQNTNQILVELQEWMGSDKSIAEAAWTSSTSKEIKELKTEEDIKRVVNMLADSKHSVPFESVVFRFWIRLPIAIDRQHMTHRIASHSGMSGRYRTMPRDYLAMPNDVKQILLKVEESELYDPEEGSYINCYDSYCSEANIFYQNAMSDIRDAKSRNIIDNTEYKRAREFLRGMLPQHNMTERVTVMNLRSFSNYYKLRSKADAQPEIQDIANKMYTSIIEENICPIAINSLAKNNWDI